jgi:hypothetical protein
LLIADFRMADSRARGGRLRHLSIFVFSIFALCGALAAAVAQTNEPPHSIQLPPDVPRFSASDLAAKVPAAKAEDVESRDAILRAIYDVISGPAGDRNWSRFRSLFLPQARFTQTAKAPDGTALIFSWSVDEFVRDAGGWFRFCGTRSGRIIPCRRSLRGNENRGWGSTFSKRISQRVFGTVRVFGILRLRKRFAFAKRLLRSG